MSNHHSRFSEFPTTTREEWQRAIPANQLSEAVIFSDSDQIELSIINTYEDLPPQDSAGSQTIVSDECILEVPADNNINREALAKIVDSGANGIFLPVDLPTMIFDLLREHHPFSLISQQFREVSSENMTKYLDYFRQLSENQRVRGTIYPAEPSVGDVNGGDPIQADFMATVTQQVRDLPSLRTVTVDGSIFHRQGASPTDELATVLSQWVACIDELTDRDLAAKEVIARSEITLATGTDYFIDLAKFRALRVLLKKVSEAYKVVDLTSSEPLLRAVSGRRNKTYYDRDSNILRNTTEALAVLIGGVHTLSLLPHDFLHSTSGEFGNRMATNVYHILRDEAHVSKVYDPAAGSYFLEDMTRQLVEKSWNLFLDFEQQGGFQSLWKNNALADRFQQSAEQQNNRVARHQEIIVGATRYINAKESADASDGTIKNENHGPRWADIFERIRRYHDARAAGEAPRAKLQLWVQQDNKYAALINTRANYIKDTLAAAGLTYQEYAIQQADDFELETNEGKLGFIFCGTDAFYETTVVDVLKNKQLDESFRWIAGGAEAATDAVRQAGGNGVLGVGHDVAALLNQTINNLSDEA